MLPALTTRSQTGVPGVAPTVTTIGVSKYQLASPIRRRSERAVPLKAATRADESSAPRSWNAYVAPTGASNRYQTLPGCVQPSSSGAAASYDAPSSVPPANPYALVSGAAPAKSSFGGGSRHVRSKAPLAPAVPSTAIE